MYSALQTTALAGLLATASAFDCSGPYFSFYNRGGDSMSYQSMDPALNPGTRSPHLHSFDGGNVISSSMGFADTQEATCTTNRIKPDKSAYWRPTLFWNGNNTGFYRVPDRFLKIYYKFGDAGNEKAPVSGFPEDFKMIAGDSMLRHDDGKVGTYNGPQLQWSCMQENYKRIDSVGFPKGFTSCKESFAAQLTFPACWNGNPINPSKPHDHMAYPTARGKGIEACPESHRKARFPTIFMEFWYDISSFDGQYSADDVPWVLANGDPTGYSFHADFLNGWEKGVLEKATAENDYCNCGCGCGEDQMRECFGKDAVNDNQETSFKQCSAKTVQFPGEDGKHFDKLPGCNPIQAGPAAATKATCGDEPEPTNVDSGAGSSSAEAPAPTSVADDAEPTPTVVDTVSSIAPVEEPVAISTSIAEAAPITFQLPSSSAIVVAPAPESTSPGDINPGYGSDNNLPADSPDAPAPSSAVTSAANAPNSPAPTSAIAPVGDGQCGAVTTIVTKEIVYVTLAPGEAAPTAVEECAAPSTVYTTEKEYVTVTVSPDPGAAYGRRHKRHVGAHVHHHHGR